MSHCNRAREREGSRWEHFRPGAERCSQVFQEPGLKVTQIQETQHAQGFTERQAALTAP